MKCEEVQTWLIDYLDNTIEEELKSRIEEHLETCEKCLDESRDLQLLLQTVENTKIEEPDESLRENFHSMLKSEKEKLQAKEVHRKVSMHFHETNDKKHFFMRIAAGIALLVAGGLLGYFINSGKQGQQSAQLTDLKKEVKEMKEMVMFSMLKEESASQRIMAVNYAEEIPNPNQNVIDALITTLNGDKNVNVRLAAAYSLAKFSDSQKVRDSLVSSLQQQKEPLVQIVLMNILTEKKEAKAVKPMQELLKRKETIKDVKEIAKKSIDVLI